MRKWTKTSAERYIAKATQKGLTYWSAMDFLKHYKNMHSIIRLNYLFLGGNLILTFL